MSSMGSKFHFSVREERECSVASFLVYFEFVEGETQIEISKPIAHEFKLHTCVHQQ